MFETLGRVLYFHLSFLLCSRHLENVLQTCLLGKLPDFKR